MSIIHLQAVGGEEPTPADLAKIEREWPLIQAEMELLDAETAYDNAGPFVSELGWRRVRRAEHRVLTIGRDLANGAPESEDVA